MDKIPAPPTSGIKEPGPSNPEGSVTPKPPVEEKPTTAASEESGPPPPEPTPSKEKSPQPPTSSNKEPGPSPAEGPVTPKPPLRKSQQSQLLKRVALLLKNQLDQRTRHPRLQPPATRSQNQVCVCAEGTFMNHEGECVPGIECPCYTGHDIVPPGKFYWVGDLACACEYGVLRCENPITMLGGRMRRESPLQVENALQLLVDGSALRGRSHAKACERTCQTINLPCPPCESDCPCGDGLIPDDNGNCIPPEDCPCRHRGIVYGKGDTIKVDCNVW
ncbi:mucin-6-like [Petromyzon marinus]|uniref:mucin-6-like n=2 Tax=Petromyzon marinus TaxID=7757 RepID=UPI003F6FD4EA